MLRVVLRLVMFLAALQLSGLGGLLVRDCCSTDDDDCATQTDQKPCNDCPAGCPKCNCNHLVFSVPPASEIARSISIEKRTSTTWAPYDAQVHPSPWRSNVFRPPRASLST